MNITKFTKPARKVLPLKKCGAVIVAAAGKLAIDERAMAKRLRLIPAGGVTGERLLAGFLPDRVECGGREVDAVIALDPGAADYNGCDGILPEILLI